MAEEKITNEIEPKVKGPGDDITDEIPLTTSISNILYLLFIYPKSLLIVSKSNFLFNFITSL